MLRCTISGTTSVPASCFGFATRSSRRWIHCTGHRAHTLHHSQHSISRHAVEMLSILAASANGFVAYPHRPQNSGSTNPSAANAEGSIRLASAFKLGSVRRKKRLHVRIFSSGPGIEKPTLKLRTDGMRRQRRLAGLPQPSSKRWNSAIHTRNVPFGCASRHRWTSRHCPLHIRKNRQPLHRPPRGPCGRAQGNARSREFGLHKINAVLVRPSAVAPLTLALHTPYRGGCVGIARPPDAGRPSVIAEQEPAHFIENIESQRSESSSARAKNRNAAIFSSVVSEHFARTWGSSTSRMCRRTVFTPICSKSAAIAPARQFIRRRIAPVSVRMRLAACRPCTAAQWHLPCAP